MGAHKSVFERQKALLPVVAGASIGTLDGLFLTPGRTLFELINDEGKEERDGKPSNREQISYWSRRSRAVFYGAALLAIANIVASFALPYPETGLEAVVFFAVLIACAYAMWRVWRDEHTYA